MDSFILTSLLALAISTSCVWLTKNLAYRRGWVAKPVQDRWHKKRIALFGGVGIFAGFIGANATLLTSVTSRDTLMMMGVLLVGASIIFLVGLVDDVRGLKVAHKLVIEIVVASLPVMFGFVWQFTPWHMVNVVATYFWFIGIMNAVNMLDNMDGLSSGIVMISTMTIIIIQEMPNNSPGDHLYLGVALAFLFSTLGFWIFNRYPATIFMGDSGSLMLGYVLAFLAIPSYLNGYMGSSSSILALLLPVSILAVPIFDTCFVTIIRKLNDLPASQGGRDHSSHRLVGLGLSESQAVNLLYGLGIMGGVIAVLMSRWPEYVTVFLVIYAVMLGLFGVYLGKVKVYPEMVNGGRGYWTPIVSELFYKRNAAEVMLDIIIIVASYYLAYLLRFEDALKENSVTYVQSLPLVVASCILSFYQNRIYEGIWKFISVKDCLRYLKSSIMGTIGAVLLITLIYRFDNYSRTVFVIFNLLLFTSLAGSRLFFRLIDNVLAERQGNLGRRIVIYGAGEGGKALYEETIRNQAYRDYKVIAFVDDDASKHKRSIAGVSIVDINSLNGWSDQIDEVWLSSNKIDDNSIRRVYEQLGRRLEVKRFKLTLERVWPTARKSAQGNPRIS